MDYKELIARLKNAAGGPDGVAMCHDAATAITDLLARAEAAEQKATELDNALSNASKVVKTMQESTIPYYRKRAEAAEKEVEWKNKVIEAAERRFMEAEARAEKAETVASDLCEDFGDFVTGGIHNAAPYCANKRPECVNVRGWCNGDNRVCKGFLPKAAVWNEE